MKAILLGLGLLVPLASAARADEPIALAANRELAVTAAGLDMDYHEIQPAKETPWINTGLYFDSREGWSPGVNLTWSDVFETKQELPSLYVRTSYQYYGGTITHYNYSTTNVAIDPQPLPIKINDLSAELGVAKMFDDRWLLAGFFQVEYFDWQRFLANANNLKEDYSFTAPGAGVRATIALTKRLALSGKLGWEYTEGVRVDGSGNPARQSPPIPFNLGSHFLGQGGVGLDYALSRQVALKLGFDFSHFAFGHSGVIRGQWEPDSFTNEGVTQLGVAWTY
jgi:hypothetical protein